jgi:hypothetical protein
MTEMTDNALEKYMYKYTEYENTFPLSFKTVYEICSRIPSHGRVATSIIPFQYLAGFDTG